MYGSMLVIMRQKTFWKTVMIGILPYMPDNETPHYLVQCLLICF